MYEDPRDEPGTLRPAVNTLVQVWDSDDWSSDDLIAQGMTDWFGYFHISGIPNGDAGGTADPRLQYRTHNSEFSVINPINGHSYYWRSSNEYSNVPDGSDINFETDFIPVNMSDAGAMWCYQYMNLAWNLAAVSGTWPGEIPCLWPNDASYHYNGSIAIYGPDADAIDIVVHEYGHAMMYKAYGDQLPATGCNPDPHYFDIHSCESFAWIEGWASFVSLAVTPDGRFNWEPNDYGFGLEDYPGIKTGPTVEGRVVGALLDLYDYPNDGWDQNSDYSVSFRQMWTNTLVPQNDTCIEHYWDYMKNNTLSYVQGYRGIMSIKQNTIDLTGVPRGDCNIDNQIDIEMFCTL